jgi:uncharacterized protein (UPF0333 family)
MLQQSGERVRAQSSLEFLIFVSIGTLFLISAVTFFGIRAQEVDEMQRISELKGICRSASSKISAIFSAGPGSKTSVEFPPAVMGENISVWMYGENRTIVVSGNENAVGCSLNLNKITNGSSTDFEIPKNSTLENVGGVVFVQ